MQSDVNKRRAERAKIARRRRLKVAFIFFLIIALISVVIMCFTLFFPVKRINVSGSQLYTKAQIIKASKITTEDQLYALSSKSVENNIRKALPYVDSVELKRVFPNAVILTITDANEMAYIVSDDGYIVLSENGYILDNKEEKPEKIFEIVTSGVTGEISQKVEYENSTEKELIEKVVTELINKDINVDKIDVTNILKITLEVEGRFTVDLGNSEYLGEKIAHLSSMIESIPNRSGAINLSMWTPQNSQGSFVENTK